MIVFELKCAKDHVFEAWFRKGDAYEAQRAAGKIACPECGSKKVSKAPMAPRLARQRGDAPAEPPSAPAVAPEQQARLALEALRAQVEARCENVGDRFAEEARKIHYGEVEKRDIYGQATDQEAGALAEEGVAFQRLPWIRRSDA